MSFVAWTQEINVPKTFFIFSWLLTARALNDAQCDMGLEVWVIAKRGYPLLPFFFK
jgi:hypothetical protein